MENNLLNTPPETGVNVVYSEFADMVLNKALLDFRKEQLRKEIDRSLENRNKEEFLRLTEELKKIS
jgi:uncharacterized protein YpiB (UPF0302 family)